MSEQDFPVLLFRCPGPHARPGGDYDWASARDEQHLAELKAAGWVDNLADAIKAFDKPAVVIVEDESEVETQTREQLEALATELGVKFDGRTSDSLLLQRIKAAQEAE
ncbi:hypothetical protein D9M71_390700 [compost metagenome]